MAARRDTRTEGWRTQVLEAKKSPEELAQTYSRSAPFYEAFARLCQSRARRRVLELADPRRGEALLEVATGTGVQLRDLAWRNRGGRTAGIDIAPGMLARTRRRLHHAGLRDVELVLADARRLPFEDAAFDLLVSSYLLDCVRRDELSLVVREFRRVLAPRGRLVLSHLTKGERRRERLWDGLYGRGLHVAANARGVLAVAVLREIGGFDDIRREYLAQKLVPTEIVSATRTG